MAGNEATFFPGTDTVAYIRRTNIIPLKKEDFLFADPVSTLSNYKVQVAPFIEIKSRKFRTFFDNAKDLAGAFNPGNTISPGTQPIDENISWNPNYPDLETKYGRQQSEAEYDVFKKEFIRLLKKGYYEPGETDESEDYARERLAAIGMEKLLKCMQEAILENPGDENVIIGVLHALSHFDYEEVYPAGTLIAAYCLAYDSDAVNEFALKAFEDWDTPKALVYLSKIRAPWLKDDLDKLRQYLERQRACE